MPPRSTPDPHASRSTVAALPRPGALAALGPRDRVIAALLVCGALAVRLFFVFRLPLLLQWPDARELEGMGRQLYSTGTFSFYTARPPGYPLFIAGVYHLFGPHLLALRILEAVLSTVAVALVGVLGLRLFGRRPAAIAMALAAFHPLLAFLPATQYSENFTFFLMMLVLVTAHSAFAHGGAWRWALTGVLLGLVTLVRPNAIAFLPGFALGAALLLHRHRRGWLAPAVITALAFALTLAPWLVRGHRVFHRWYFISTGGGRQLWLGNNERTIADTRVEPVLEDSLRARIAALGDGIDQDRWFVKDAQRFMREHPARAARLYVQKLANILALYPETSTRTYVNPASRISQGLATLLIFAGGLLGLARLRDHPALWPMLLGSLTFVLATALAFSSFRYRMFVEPCLILWAGVGWGELGLRRAAVPAESHARTARVAS